MAYGSLLPQTILSIIYFPATDGSARTRELLLLADATATATMLISAIWPTLGLVAAHGSGDVAYLRDMLALRAGGPWHFECDGRHRNDAIESHGYGAAPA